MHLFLHETLRNFSQRMMTQEKLPTDVLNLILAHDKKIEKQLYWVIISCPPVSKGIDGFEYGSLKVGGE